MMYCLQASRAVPLEIGAVVRIVGMVDILDFCNNVSDD